jgi:hypothetical protein
MRPMVPPEHEGLLLAVSDLVAVIDVYFDLLQGVLAEEAKTASVLDAVANFRYCLPA